MNSPDPVATIVGLFLNGNVTVQQVLAGLVVALLTGALVPGWVYKKVVKERDDLAVALQQHNLAGDRVYEATIAYLVKPRRRGRR